VVVNVNPLYTPRELEHQLKDSGAKAIVVLENFAATLEQVIAARAHQAGGAGRMGDMLGLLKGTLVNHVVRNVKKMVPASAPGAVRFNDAVAAGRRCTFTAAQGGADDIAVLQYTGGTTGVSKGAVLLHRNLVANVLQAEAWYQPGAARRSRPASSRHRLRAAAVSHLRLHHEHDAGHAHGRLQHPDPNPRDIPGGAQGAVAAPVPQLPGGQHAVQRPGQPPRLRQGRLEPPEDQRRRRHGGAAGHRRLWLEKTGCPICEGYGLSETSPSATCNPVDSTAYSGTIGLPMPGTELKLLDDDGNEVPPGTPGEIAIRGPQVMAGYWQRPDETAKVMTADGFFRTGDIGVVDERGYFRIVDRKKDMILVSGFNVYPNEVEDVITQMPGVLECAAVGVPDAKAGEAVKVVIVRRTRPSPRPTCAPTARPTSPATSGRRSSSSARPAQDAGGQDPAPRTARWRSPRGSPGPTRTWPGRSIPACCPMAVPMW
jgi:long-chain acyl-CoA synthetase